MTATTRVVSDFIHELRFDDLPRAVRHQARRCLLDLVAVTAAGTATALSRIIRDHVAATPGPSSAPLLFDGRVAAVPSAAMANAATIDSMDGHDGHRIAKGHAGASAFPAVMAFSGVTSDPTTEDLLAALVVGYEIALRGGTALHRTAHDYHSSGAWNALGAAAVGVRALRLDRSATAEALGIAEYTAPRGPMMRTIDHPTMVKDSSAWGARAGAEAALLAAEGFTGAPAELLDDIAVADLGERWMIMEQYLKPHPVCRWAQPAVDAMLSLTGSLGIDAAQVETIDVVTFAPATALAISRPTTTEEAQYSLPFSVAAAAVHGSIEPEVLLDPVSRTDVMRISERVRILESTELTAQFPAQRWARVTLRLADGTSTTSALTRARGDPEDPLTDDEILDKFRRYTARLGETRAERLALVIMGPHTHSAAELHDLLGAPMPGRPS